MTLDHHQKTEALFHEVLALEPQEREAYLAEACEGDPKLFEEVNSLLAAHQKGSDFFEKPVWSTLIPTQRTDKTGLDALVPEEGLPLDRLGEGDFRLIRRLGEGGMGVVYLAVQESLGRLVAIKAMRAERLGSPEAQARFQREIEAISELRHPNIVTVFESGEEQGLRYFVMEYLPGDGLDRILRAARTKGEKISIPKLLGWIQGVASALDCAHQARILHRDVKPSNIVISPEGRPMLMDFGVARHMDLSTLTLTGSFRGTPNYASPEQVKASHGGIDGRTDIYSLGVTLYEAVTGQVPFQGETTEQVFKKILDEEPPPPRRLNPFISRDLETVILTAMDKEPAGRYASMADFAQDLKHLMQGEMILARPTGMVTRFWKRIRRNPVLSTASVVAVIAVVSLFLYVLWSYPQILKERDRAEMQREEALKAKTAAEREASKFQAINRFLESMLASADPSVAGREVKMVDLLKPAAEQIGVSFSEEPAVEAALRETMGKTFAGLGLLEEAESEMVQALKLYQSFDGDHHETTWAAMNSLANVYRMQDRLDEAESLYREIIERGSARFGEEHAMPLAALHNLGLVFKDRGKLDEAESTQRKVLEIRRRTQGAEDPDTLKSMNNLASVCWQQGKLDEAEAIHREVLQIKKRLFGEEHPSTLVTMNNLALTLKNLGRLDESETLMRKVMEAQARVLGPEHPDALAAVYNLGNLLYKAGKFSESEAVHRKALEARTRTLGAQHQASLASRQYVAILCWEQGKMVEAEALFKEVWALSKEALGEAHPNTLMVLNNLIALYEAWGKPEQAERHRKYRDQ